MRLTLSCDADGVSLPSAVTCLYAAAPSEDDIVSSMPCVKPLFALRVPVLPTVTAYMAMSPSETVSAVVEIGLVVPVFEADAPAGVVWFTLPKNADAYAVTSGAEAQFGAMVNRPGFSGDSVH